MNKGMMRLWGENGLLTVLAFVLLAGSLVFRWQYAVASSTTDYYLSWVVPEALARAPIGDIYAADAQQRMEAVLRETPAAGSQDRLEADAAVTAELYRNGAYSIHSPFLYSVMALLSRGDYEADRRVFIAFCIACFSAAVLLLGTVLGFGLPLSMLFLVFFNYQSAPLVSDMTVGNVNQVQLLQIALFSALLARAHRFAAGVMLGLGIMFKLNTAFLLPVAALAPLLDGEWRKGSRLLAGTAAGAAGAVFLSLASIGTWSMWGAFFRNLFARMNVPSLNGVCPLENGNYGLSMLLYRATNRDVSSLLAMLLLAAVAAVFLLTRRVAGRASDRERALQEAFLAAGAGSAIMLLSSPLVWLHYYLFLVPAALYLLRPAGDGGRVILRIAAGFALALLSTLVAMLLDDVLYEAIAVNAAALLLLLLILLERWLDRTSGAIMPAGAAAQEGASAND